MELSTHEQIFDLLGKAKKILIILPKVLDEDSLSSGLALARFLIKLEKDAEVFSSGEISKNLLFLPGALDIKKSLPNSQGFVISVNVSEKQVSEISYQNQGSHFNIFLKPKEKMFTPEDVSFNAEKFPADALVFIGCKSADDAGDLFAQAPDLFFETPKINIDHQAGNEYFGNINLADVTATSTAEILSSLFEKYETQLVDADIATCLLAGIIAKTHSFQHVTTTPRAFLQASNLIGLGGRQQEIIKNIYKTKSLLQLKLWGKALEQLKIAEEKSLVYSVLSLSDFEQAKTESENLLFVVGEILENVGGFQTVGLIAEKNPNEVEILTALHVSKDAASIAAVLGGEVLPQMQHGYRLVSVKSLPLSLEEAESKFVSAVSA